MMNFAIWGAGDWCLTGTESNAGLSFMHSIDLCKPANAKGNASL